MFLKINFKSLCFILLFCSKSYSQNLPVKTVDINYLVNMIEGSFTINEQTQNDSGYFDIEMHIKKIWGDRTDGKWLYVEQTHSQTPQNPYLQRVYRITQSSDRTFESAVFTISDPLRFAGDWSKANPLAELTPDSLTLLEGCTVYLSFSGENSFEGSTKSTGCRSDSNGTNYITSEVTITEDKIVTRDNGFNQNSEKVWDAEYIYTKLKQ